MTTNVPPPSFGPNGFVIPTEAAVLAGVQADINNAFGGGLNFGLTGNSPTPQGQLATSETAIIGEANNTFLYYTTQTDPAQAQGRMLDAIARLYFLERLPSEPTVLQVACAGLQGVVIPVNALIVDTAGNQYGCTEAGTIPSLGTITLPFANLIPGPTAVPQANQVTIFQAIPGWDSVSATSGITGKNVESDAQFRLRRSATVAVNSVGSLPSVQGAVLKVPGVLGAYVTENDSTSPATIGGVTLAANSLYVAVIGGLATDIARAIWSKKAPGCAYNGTTSVVVTDTSPGYNPPYPSYTVSFQIPAVLEILFAVNIVNSAQVPSNATTLIQNAIISAFGGNDGGPAATIGSNIYASRFVADITALGAWAQVISVFVGSNNTAGAVITGRITATTLTVDSVVSGTVADGQTLSDAQGNVIVGNTIVSGASVTWTVSNSQTLGATFTGTGSTTNLTASAVTGTIAVGDVVTGTGVPGSTTIVSQTSGTPGGAGVYVTNNSTTSSGASLKASATITLATATLNLVTAQINQIPALAAANIKVTLV